MISAVIFDMDGLMFDTEPLWASCWPVAAKDCGVPFKEGLPEAARGTNGDEAVAIVRDWYGDEVDARAFVDRYYEVAHERLKDGAEKKLGLDELLEFLAERGTPMAVASSSSREMIQANLARAGISDYFAAVVSGLEVEHAKPFPDVFLRAASQLAAEPEDALVLEDSYNGVRAGVAGGFRTVMVPDLSEPTEEMECIATTILPSLVAVKEAIVQGLLS